MVIPFLQASVPSPSLGEFLLIASSGSLTASLIANCMLAQQNRNFLQTYQELFLRSSSLTRFLCSGGVVYVCAVLDLLDLTAFKPRVYIGFLVFIYIFELSGALSWAVLTATTHYKSTIVNLLVNAPARFTSTAMLSVCFLDRANPREVLALIGLFKLFLVYIVEECFVRASLFTRQFMSAEQYTFLRNFLMLLGLYNMVSCLLQ